jgi:hypothetical protein
MVESFRTFFVFTVTLNHKLKEKKIKKEKKEGKIRERERGNILVNVPV